MPSGSEESSKFEKESTHLSLRGAKRRSNLSMYVYMMSNSLNTVIYTGVTNNLFRRVWEHKSGIPKTSFTSKYHLTKLVYYEIAESAYVAISREKQLKAGSRAKKNMLIATMNPTWKDLLNDIVGIEREIASSSLRSSSQ